MYKETFGQKLKKARDDCDLSQAEAAQKVGVSQQNLSKYENGVLEPSIETLGKLCDLYCVSADWLIGTKGANL